MCLFSQHCEIFLHGQDHHKTATMTFVNNVIVCACVLLWFTVCFNQGLSYFTFQSAILLVETNSMSHDCCSRRLAPGERATQEMFSLMDAIYHRHPRYENDNDLQRDCIWLSRHTGSVSKCYIYGKIIMKFSQQINNLKCHVTSWTQAMVCFVIW